MSSSPLVAGIELGGTKSVAVLARGATILERQRLRTDDPASTLDGLSKQLAGWASEGQHFDAIGIGSFGPVGLNRQRPDYGFVTTTPKSGWESTDVRGHFAERFDVPIGFDNDVNGAVLAENKWGAAQGCSVAIYLTVGTGIGGGVIVDGRLVHGLVHPEHGHLRVRRRADDRFPGVCPYHGDCIEGLASGPAIAARCGSRAPEIPPEHPVWIDVASELGEFMAILVLALSPQRIVVGGGVGYGQRWLLPQIRAAALATVAGYVAALDEAAIEALIVPAGLGDDAGPLGSVAIGLDALAASG